MITIDLSNKLKGNFDQSLVLEVNKRGWRLENVLGKLAEASKIPDTKSTLFRRDMGETKFKPTQLIENVVETDNFQY